MIPNHINANWIMSRKLYVQLLWFSKTLNEELLLGILKTYLIVYWLNILKFSGFNKKYQENYIFLHVTCLHVCKPSRSISISNTHSYVRIFLLNIVKFGIICENCKGQLVSANTIFANLVLARNFQNSCCQLWVFNWEA